MLYKKDFEAIAAIIKKNTFRFKETLGCEAYSVIRRDGFMGDIADWLETKSPEFDRDKFFMVCSER